MGTRVLHVLRARNRTGCPVHRPAQDPERSPDLHGQPGARAQQDGTKGTDSIEHGVDVETGMDQRTGNAHHDSKRESFVAGETRGTEAKPKENSNHTQLEDKPKDAAFRQALEYQRVGVGGKEELRPELHVDAGIGAKATTQDRVGPQIRAKVTEHLDPTAKVLTRRCLP